MDELKLRNYQEKSIQQLRIAFTQGGKHQIMVAPCAAGKTVIAASIIKSVIERGKKVIFLIDRIVLANQTSETLDKYGIPHGIMQGQHERYEPHQLCQIVSGQTLIRRECPDDIALVIQDEAHVRSKAVERLAAYNKDAYFVGVTATPFAKGMAKFWDGCIVIAKARELTDSGHLVPLRYYAKAAPDTSKVKISCGEYNLKELAEVTDKAELTGDVVKNWLENGEDRQTIAFGINISHCKHMAQEFNRRGIVTEQIDCFTDAEDRAGMFRRFKSGETRILTSVAVLSVGFSETSASCCIMARATKSLILWYQCVGRIARTHEGKTDGIVFDHGNNAVNLGLPTDEQDYTLDDGKPKKESKARERKEPLPKACDSCGYIKPAGTHKCPSCGFKPERIESPDFESGELVELKRKKKANKNMTWEEKTKYMGGFKFYAESHGFNPGWASHAYKNLTSVWPNDRRVKNAIAKKPDEEVAAYIKHLLIRSAYAKKTKLRR